jgi:hypothetical protein
MNHITEYSKKRIREDLTKLQKKLDKLKTSIDLAEYCVRRMKKYAYRARVPWKWAALRADMRRRVPEAELHRWASA